MGMYGIMRVEKRNRGSVYGLQIEANRTVSDHDKGRDFGRSMIDWNKTDENIHLIKCNSYNREITRQIKDAGLKEKKSSVVMLDGLFTASPEFFQGKTKEQQIAYFRDCLSFFQREYKCKVINAVIHFDETTPHMHIAAVPIVMVKGEPHLSAKIIMGNRTDYRKHQNRFYEQISKHYGLERGEVIDNPRKHIDQMKHKITTCLVILDHLKSEIETTGQDRDSLLDEINDLRRQIADIINDFQPIAEQKLLKQIANYQLVWRWIESNHPEILEEWRAYNRQLKQREQSQDLTADLKARHRAAMQHKQSTDNITR